MHPPVEYGGMSHLVPPRERIRRSADNLLSYAEDVAELRSLSAGDLELVAECDAKLAELRASATVLDELADEHAVEIQVS